ncbi:glycosyltransferase family 4 protein [Dyadobacter flavalbus]|uniref:Glycosyltransferase family 4 protein n=1 Tax=Dyadobacter flavalbus TaxID=2579942 RepID=A0A5M8QY22_9BACT|nr:glycosyltransferase family 4 protein [Dyadobacter flavalbus]KAA6441177.1 glycosyltransferase family 4 protein [Dyadobacter flavalbus]
MSKKLYFISRDANWQHYRNEVLTYLANKHDYQVEILTTGQLKPYLHENDRLKYKIFKNVFSDEAKKSFFPGALSYMLKNKPGYVLGLNNGTQLTEYIGILLCKLAGIKFIAWTHAYDHKPITNPLKKLFKAAQNYYFFTLADSIVTFSYAGRDYLIEKGFPKEKIHVAPNTLDTNRLLAIKEKIKVGFDRTSFLKTISPEMNENSKVIIFSGRLNKFKKVDAIIRAMALLNKQDPNIHLIVVGDGDQMTLLKELAISLNIQNKVHFTGYIFEETIVGKYFLASDIFIMPGYVGLAIVHAFSYGLPLITEDIDFHSPEIQLLHDGQNGYFVKENDEKQLADKILHLLSDKALLQQLSTNALKTIQEEASIDLMVERMNTAITQ